MQGFNPKVSYSLYLAVMLALLLSCSTEKKPAIEYPIEPVPFTSIKVTDKFWAPRIKKNHDITIPIAFGYCESTGRIKNFEIAGGQDTGRFQSFAPFDDSDVYKIIEGASYSLQTFPDKNLDLYLDSIIGKIALAQEYDGYLYTNRTIAEQRGEEPHEWAGNKRWELTNILSCELYNLGHLYEAAVAHYQATGKTNLLDIAVKSANLLVTVFNWNAFISYPGHQGIEMGLVKLYGVTGKREYLDLAKFFLDARGERADGEEYTQSHCKVVDQSDAVGHSVRATYMYSGMADIAAILKDEAYIHAITKIWEDIVNSKIYITGGIGASVGNEGFREPYYLPNMSAYCETCASIGNIFANQRLFLMHGESKYSDIIEKTLYNGMLSGVSLSADRFFYPNPLESNGQHERSAWFGCACCPSNIARFIPSIAGYIYATKGSNLYVNLFISSEAEFNLGNREISVSQKTEYPWDGKVKIAIDDASRKKIALMVRIPGWARDEAISGNLYAFSERNSQAVKCFLNGKEINPEITDGYMNISHQWEKADLLEIDIPMPVRTVIADERIQNNIGKVAVQKGPLIYCAEWPDNKDGHILNLILDQSAGMTYAFREDLLNGTGVIKTKARQAKRSLNGDVTMEEIQELNLIPYHLWANRGAGQMMVWLPVTAASVKPLAAPTIAARSEVSASKETKSRNSIKDQYEPQNSNDLSFPYYHWWPEVNKWEWLQYDFEAEEKVSRVKVYWFDDSPFGGCRIPAEWKIEYKDGKLWKAVETLNEYPVTLNSWDIVDFKTVQTNGLRLLVKLPENYSSGVHEWVVE